MSRGRRYNNEPKLNIKKVIAVILAVVLIVLFVIAIKNLLKSDNSANHLVSTTYFLLNKDGKWGVIDNNAKIVIEPSYEDAIIIPNSKKDIFICTYNANYEKNIYETKVLNSKGNQILTDYKQVEALENYDNSNNLWYEDNVLLVKKDEKYGLINFDGKKLLNIEFDSIKTLKGTKNSLIIEKDGKKGVVNCLGQEQVPAKYDEIKSLGENTKLYIVKEKGKYGIDGILDCKYQEIKALNNKEVFCVKEKDEYKVINTDNKVVFNEKFDSIKSIKDNIIVYKYKDKYGAYDIKNKLKIRANYKELNYTTENLLIAKTNNKYGIIDINGNKKIEEKYKSIHFYQDANLYELEEKNTEENIILDNNLNKIAKGMIATVNTEKNYIKLWTEEGYSYYNLKGETKTVTEVLANNGIFLNKKDNKYGFLDKNGNIVVDYIYDDATEQNEFGYSAVKKDGLWGCIDKNGKEVCEIKYNLDDNLLIDFIGEYHLGEDLNLMYYTDK